MKTIAFVIPWFGFDIPGGAEMELKGLVSHLHDAGVKVEILTTCVKEFTSSWSVNHCLTLLIKNLCQMISLLRKRKKYLQMKM